MKQHGDERDKIQTVIDKSQAIELEFAIELKMTQDP